MNSGPVWVQLQGFELAAVGEKGMVCGAEVQSNRSGLASLAPTGTRQIIFEKNIFLSDSQDSQL